MSEGASGSARQLERITAIDRFLRGSQYPTTADLARELGVSERTVYRDLVFLRDRLGAPVGYDARRRGYLYTRPHRFFPGVSLTAQEVLALLLAARVAGPLLGQLFGERVRQAVRKILGAGGLGRALLRGDGGRHRSSAETNGVRPPPEGDPGAPSGRRDSAQRAGQRGT